jgi:hypothetical protein
MLFDITCDTCNSHWNIGQCQLSKKTLAYRLPYILVEKDDKKKRFYPENNPVKGAAFLDRVKKATIHLPKFSSHSEEWSCPACDKSLSNLFVFCGFCGKSKDS